MYFTVILKEKNELMKKIYIKIVYNFVIQS